MCKSCDPAVHSWHFQRSFSKKLFTTPRSILQKILSLPTLLIYLRSECICCWFYLLCLCMLMRMKCKQNSAHLYLILRQFFSRMLLLVELSAVGARSTIGKRNWEMHERQKFWLGYDVTSFRPSVRTSVRTSAPSCKPI